METEEKFKFKLSKFNKYYSLVLILVGLIGLKNIENKEPGYYFGAFLGTILKPYIIPLIFAWFTWLLVGKKKNAGNFVFTFMVSLLILVEFLRLFSFYDDNNLQKEELEKFKKEFVEEKTKLKKVLLTGNNDEINKQSDAYGSFAIKKIDKFIQISKGDTKTLLID